MTALNRFPARSQRDSVMEGDYESASMNPFLIVGQLLRGRLVLAASLALGLGLLGGICGFLLQRPSYASIGIIQVSANKRGILYESSDDSRLRLFDAFVGSEASYLGSRPVLERALSDARIEDLGWSQTSENLRRIRESIKIESKGGMITVIGSHREPETAAVIVNALLDAYEEMHVEYSRRVDSVRERQLAHREVDLLQKLTELEDQMRDTGQEYGLQSIAAAHVRKVAQIQEVDQRVAELETTIASREAADALSEVDTGDVEIKRLVVLDHALADMLFDRAQRAADLNALPNWLSDSHPTVRAAKLSLETIDAAVEDRRQQLATLGTTGALTKAGKSAEQESLDGLKALFVSLSERADSLREDGKELNGRFIRLEFLDQEREQVRHLLDETRTALEEVRVESQNTLPGTVEVKSRGSIPTQPASDKRKVMMLAGALGGGVFGVASLLGFAFLFRRLRFSDELSATLPDVVLAGTLPKCDDFQKADPDFQLAIHKLRNRLQLSNSMQSRKQLIVVCGVQERSGVTATSIALAHSFAESRQRTVAVDADLLNESMTREMGFRDREGVREALVHDRLNGEVNATDVDNLFAVPSGCDRMVTDQCVSKHAVAAMFQRLREQFDVVVVDAGCCDQHLTAQVAAALADDVLLLIPADVPAKVVKRVVTGAKSSVQNVQVVFNQAHHSDPGLIQSF
ncbi:MAG: hypothetical protein AAGG48_21215 [Planctomycetota bacterium]